MRFNGTRDCDQCNMKDDEMCLEIQNNPLLPFFPMLHVMKSRSSLMALLSLCYERVGIDSTDITDNRGKLTQSMGRDSQSTFRHFWHFSQLSRRSFGVR